MKKAYRLFLITSLSLLAACAQNNATSSKTTSAYSQIGSTRVATQPAVGNIDVGRYSAMHITQASYLFK